MRQLSQPFHHYGKHALLLGVIAWLGMAPVRSQSLPEGAILTIDGKPVMLEEFKYLYNKNYNQQPQAYDEASIRDYLTLFVNFKLKIAEAEKLGMDEEQAFLKEFETYRQQLVQPYLNSSEMKQAMLEEAYERLQSEVWASHILIQVPPFAPPSDTAAAYQKIQSIREKIMDGADFGAMAQRYSEDPSAQQNKGSLGYFTAMQMVYGFETAAYETPVGDISGPVRTKFGYHLVKVHDKRPSRGSVKVAHIMVRATEGMGQNDSLAAVKKIHEIANQLENGGNWDELCRQFSDDMATRNNGGELKWFSTGSMVGSFADAAFALDTPGETSPPTQTPYGWHLLKLIDKKSLGTFQDMQAELREKLSRDSRSETMKEQFIQQLKSEYRFQEDLNLQQQLFKAILSGKSSEAGRLLPENSDLGMQALFQFGGRKFTGNDFSAFLANKRIPGTDSLARVFLYAQYDQFVKERVMAFEEENLPNKYPEFKHLVREYREGLLLFRIMEEEVWNQAVEDTLGLKAFFEANRQAYQWDERVKAVVIHAESEQMAQEVMAEYEQGYYHIPNQKPTHLSFAPQQTDWGDSIVSVVDKLVYQLKINPGWFLKTSAYSAKTEKKTMAAQRLEKMDAYFNARNIELGRILPMENLGRKKTAKGAGGGVYLTFYSQNLADLEAHFNEENPLAVNIDEGIFERGDNAALDSVAWEKDDHLLQKDNRSYLIRIFEVLPQKLKQLDECRGQVISDYQTFLEEKWVEGLHNRYEVKINEKAIDTLIEK